MATENKSHAEEIDYVLIYRCVYEHAIYSHILLVLDVTILDFDLAENPLDCKRGLQNTCRHIEIHTKLTEHSHKAKKTHPISNFDDVHTQGGNGKHSNGPIARVLAFLSESRQKVFFVREN